MLDPGRKQRETADCDTPARCATSYDVGMVDDADTGDWATEDWDTEDWAVGGRGSAALFMGP